MTITRQQIAEAFRAVGQTFPVPDYFQDYMRTEVEEITLGLAHHAAPFEGKRLLDVGSGPMDKTAVFARLGFDCHAADDLSDPWHRTGNMLEAIQTFGKANGVKFHLQTPDNYAIPFEDASFDVVTCIDVIEHLHETPRHILNAMGEKLKTGGLLLVAMPNSVNLRKRLSVLRGRTNYAPADAFYYGIGPYRGHVREYTLAETVDICRWNGFEIVEARTFEHLAEAKLGGFAAKVYRALGNIFPGFRSALLVISRKPEGWQPAGEDPKRYFDAIRSALPTDLGPDRV